MLAHSGNGRLCVANPRRVDCKPVAGAADKSSSLTGGDAKAVRHGVAVYGSGDYFTERRFLTGLSEWQQWLENLSIRPR